jgi:uncharacterized membrane protein YeiH
MYVVELIGSAVFAMTGVLAVSRRGLDLIAALMLGAVTAVGGGTIRDLLMRYPIFWFDDFNYLWAALVGAVLAFFLTALIQNINRGLLYLDGLGAALFAIAAADKALVGAALSGPIAVILGVITGIGGGLLRDVLAGRPTLLMSRDIYATPILIGCTLFVLLHQVPSLVPQAAAIGTLFIFVLRAVAIRFHLEMPAALVQRDSSAHGR